MNNTIGTALQKPLPPGQLGNVVNEINHLIDTTQTKPLSLEDIMKVMGVNHVLISGSVNSNGAVMYGNAGAGRDMNVSM